jgi:pyruvate dehydrogenase E1 component alpha subunit
MAGRGQVAAAFFGDGAVDEGVFYESLNFAALKRLPVLFVCENNGYATHSAQAARQPLDNIYERAEIWGAPGVRVDGNDVTAVYSAARTAVERARAGDGPTLLECRTYRWMEHVGPNTDRSRAEFEEWQARCPIRRTRAELLRDGLVTEDELDVVVAGIAAEIDEAVRFGQMSPVAAPETLADAVYA